MGWSGPSRWSGSNGKYWRKFVGKPTATTMSIESKNLPDKEFFTRDEYGPARKVAWEGGDRRRPLSRFRSPSPFAKKRRPKPSPRSIFESEHDGEDATGNGFVRRIGGTPVQRAVVVVDLPEEPRLSD